jgi:uncharacterized membrane protein
MLNKKNRFMALAAISLLPGALFAQAGEAEMADAMRSNGKIYVVIAVILTILTGLLLYVWRLDRKITKLENETK